MKSRELPGYHVRYLRDCYEADSRETALFDLRHRKIQHYHLLEHGVEFLTGMLDLIPLGWTLAVEVQKAAELHETEKMLVFGAFQLEGRVSRSNPSSSGELHAPLLYFPATLEIEGPHAFLRVDPREQRINAKVLAGLLGESESCSSCLEEILGSLPQVPFEPHRVQQIISVFEEFLPSVDTSGLIEFAQPGLSRSGESSRSAREARGGGVRCTPVCCMALVPNSPETRDVLSELATIGAAATWSAPLRALTGVEHRPGRRKGKRSRLRLPATLSGSQTKAVRSAASNVLTLVIGPPGTGKSFTLAALAVEHVLRGESVLIAARTSQALDVLAEKIGVLLGDERLILRGGRAGYTRQLKDTLADWLHGPPAAERELVDDDLVRGLRREVTAQARALEQLERALELRAGREIQWGDDKAGPRDRGLMARSLRACRLKITDWQLARQGCYWDLMANYQRQLEDHHRGIARYLRALIELRRERALLYHRREFVTLERALRSRTNRKQEEWFSRLNLPLLLQTFPIWMSPTTDVGALLPLKPELFSLAIVDEATQCDLASCLPVFYRARRAVVTGDPKQLRHVSFLARDRQRLLAKKWGVSERDGEVLDYRGKGLLDWVDESLQSQDQVAVLDEHFRSRPAIIAFSNREFYRGALKIMTRRPDTLAMPSVELRLTKGRRDGNGPNREEAEQLIGEVVRRVESERGVGPGVVQSLGILSPFREQVDYLFGGLTKRLDLQSIKRHRLRVGTAHSFQGEERDVMFLSLVVDREAHPAALRYLDRPDVFNVSITRARNLQLVFCSIEPAALPASSLLRRYLESISQDDVACAASAHTDAFLLEVQQSLSERGFETWPGYQVAGLAVDMLVTKGGCSLGIDLVGHPGALAPAFDIEKYRLFARAGLRLFPLSISGWKRQRSACLEAIDRWHAVTAWPERVRRNLPIGSR